MRYAVNYGSFNGIFPLPTIVADKFLKISTKEELKVLIAILRHSDELIDSEVIALRTNILEASVREALETWSERGVLSLNSGVSEVGVRKADLSEDSRIIGSDRGVMNPTIRVKAADTDQIGEDSVIAARTTESERTGLSRDFGVKTVETDQANVVSASVTQIAVADRVGECSSIGIKIAEADRTGVSSEQANGGAKATQKINKSFFKYTFSDVSKRLKESKEMKNFMDEVQSVFGRELTHVEISAIVSLLDYTQLKCESMILLIQYCKVQNKMSMRYLEKLAYDIVDKEIVEYEQISEYMDQLMLRGKNEGIIRDSFGINNRALTAKEKNFLNIWFEEYQLDTALIRMAYDRTVEKLGKVSFDYINKILINWREDGVRTTNEILEKDKQRKNQTQSRNSDSTYDLDAFLQAATKDIV